MLNRMAMPRGKAAAMTTGMNQVGGFLTHNTGCGCASCGGKPISQRELSNAARAENRGVVFMGPNTVEVQGIPFPKLELDSSTSPVASERQTRKCEHGAILKVVTTNICGSDQHMVRGRTSLPGGHMVLGHEITGEVVEVGNGCEFLEVGDICSVPFNIACGRCDACKRGDTGVCLKVNPARPGAAYGYVDMGGWIGGQSEYVMIPYADFNLLKFPDRAQALEKITDLTCLSDILPTGYHGAVTAGVGPGSTVYVAGAGPVGLAAAASAQLLGAAVVIVGDMIPERLEQARSFGCETIDLRQEGSLRDHVHAILGSYSEGRVDGAVDCVGFEARGTGAAAAGEVPAQVLNDCMSIVREGGKIGNARRPWEDRYAPDTARARRRHPGALRDVGPGRRGRGLPGRLPQHPDRPRLEPLPVLYDWPMPCDEIQQGPDDGDPLRQDQDRRRRQRPGHLPRRRVRGLRRLRPGRRQEVRHRPPRHDRQGHGRPLRTPYPVFPNADDLLAWRDG